MSTAEEQIKQKGYVDQENKDQKEQNENEERQTQPEEVRQILRTSDFYKTKNLPERFDRPGLTILCILLLSYNHDYLYIIMLFYVDDLI